MYEFVVLAKLIVVKVIDDDVVRTGFTVTQTTRRLSTTAGKELHTALCLELALLPSAVVLLLSEVGDETLVVFQFRLNISKQSVCIVLRLSHDHHKVDKPLRLEHQPERREYIKVGRFGVAARPHEYSLQVGRVSDLACSFVVERGVVNGAYDLAGRLVTQLQEVGKVILAERCIVVEQAFDTHVSFYWRFAFQE